MSHVKTDEALLQVRGLKKHFGHLEVLRGIDIDIHKGEVVAVIGPSGSGKSTFIRCLNRLEEPTAGEVIFEGQQINTKNADIDKIRQKIGMVFQNFNLFSNMTIMQNITAAPINVKKIPKAQAEERALKLLDRVGLKDKAAEYPVRLSGGQRQRVAMGRAIVRDPAVFLFDEPLSNLDAKLRVQMRLELQQLHRRLKTTSLYVTHDQVEAMTLAQRVMVMNGGVAEQIGTPVEVYEKPASLFVASFIGSPAMNLLTGRVNNEGTHFELDGGIELPLNGGYRQYAGRKMTLGIRPEHIALSSQAEGGVPLVMDTLEILGADNLAHGRWGEQKLVVRLAHQERPTAGSTLWLHLAENQLHLFDGETGQRV